MESSFYDYYKYVFKQYYFYIIVFNIFIFLLLVIKRKGGIFQIVLGSFLICVLLLEFAAAYVSSMGKPNTWLYNIYNVIEIDTYLLLSYYTTQYRLYKKIIGFCIIVYTIGCAINFLFIQKEDEFHSFTYALGCILLVLASMLYFLSIFRFPQADNIKKQPGFWLATALLFYYIASMPVFGMLNFLKEPPQSLLDNYNLIVGLLNGILYTLLAISMVCHLNWPQLFNRKVNS